MASKVPARDTIDKIVTVYFAAVTKREFSYKRKTYKPHPLTASPLLFRGFICNPNCGGCCLKFSLDYLPTDDIGPVRRSRFVDFDGKRIQIDSDLQLDNEDHFCRYLDKSDGRCGIHGEHPFSCDFELLRFLISETRPNIFIHKLFGRGWNMLRIDGERGALCEMLQIQDDQAEVVARKLTRLKEWADHFGLLETCLPELIDWAERGPHDQPGRFNQEFDSSVQKGFFS